MLTLLGRSAKYCDGISRRSFLKIGGFALGASGGLSLADLLRAEAAAGNRPSTKSVINVFLAGGPPHQDMWDIKTEAPVEIRGEFKPIATKVPGIEIGEVFPGVASHMDKLTVIRSVVGCVDRHDAYQCMSGWSREELANSGGHPSIGAVVARLQGAADRAVPPFVGLAARTRERRWSDSGSPGFLGSAYAPFKPYEVENNRSDRRDRLVDVYEQGPGMANLTLTDLTLDRLGDRKQLLESFDRARRIVDRSGMASAMDAFNQTAFDVLTSSKLVDALDLSKEDPRTVERYGTGRPYKYQYDGAPTVNEHLLLARRLVEAGVRCVTLSFGRWDSHGKNFDLVRDHGTKLDQCFSALIQDLTDRRMLDDVTVVVWGEFGRTPRINNNAGRDHWPQLNSAVLAGGGMPCGQVIGASNRLGEYATNRPVHMQQIVARIYRNLGVDVETTLVDPSGRPQYLVDVRDPIPELA